ncbi:MAG TPA: hypothetical protein DCE42_04180, partial [Myxococcales bacterium]|nr:hypothetical protein [Myxococcales bacterium]
MSQKCKLFGDAAHLPLVPHKESLFLSNKSCYLETHSVNNVSTPLCETKGSHKMTQDALFQQIREGFSTIPLPETQREQALTYLKEW